MVEEGVIEVFLGDVPVGLLTQDDNGVNTFRLHASYIEANPRPILGQAFEDNPRATLRTRMRLPSYFSNLLPEGPLRELIARQVGVKQVRERYLLAHLGEDLPGAVRAVPSGAIAREEEDSTPSNEVEPVENVLHFSLAGVQLKFSMLRSDRGLTLPMSGRGGDWIVKLPDVRHRLVPENEWSTMTWARESGLGVPNFELVKVAELGGLPMGEYMEPLAYAVKRFDREGPRRVHIEDFAQVLGVYPDEKYKHYNYETLGRIISAAAGKDALEEYLRRLVFMVASGNADAHLKNWSLMYPDGQTPKLTPAYDLVTTVAYIPDDKLALNLGKSKGFDTVTEESFRRLSDKVNVSETWALEVVRSAIDRTMDAYRRLRSELRLDRDALARLDAHQARVPLLARR